MKCVFINWIVDWLLCKYLISLLCATPITLKGFTCVHPLSLWYYWRVDGQKTFCWLVFSLYEVILIIEWDKKKLNLCSKHTLHHDCVSLMPTRRHGEIWNRFNLCFSSVSAVPLHSGLLCKSSCSVTSPADSPLSSSSNPINKGSQGLVPAKYTKLIW